MAGSFNNQSFASTFSHLDSALLNRIQSNSVLIVGRMISSERYKGHDQLIEAWPLVKAQVPDAQLVIVGHGDDVNRIKTKALSTGFQDSVLFTGHVNDATLQAIYDRVAIFVMTSRSEGFGVVYLEAMQHGLPCIGSIHDAAKEIIEHEVTGLLVDQDDVSGLANAIAGLLLNPSRRTEMGKAGFQRLQTAFSFEQFQQTFSYSSQTFNDLKKSSRRTGVHAVCGIAGIISHKSIDETSLQRMSGALGHRGPDDRGMFSSDDGRCALAHTRLSILDLSSAGHQPMGLGEQGAWSGEHSQCAIRNAQRKQRSARYWITYNGEIYNYLQLREELGVRGEGEGAGSGEQGISNFGLRISDLKSQEQGAGSVEHGAWSTEHGAGDTQFAISQPPGNRIRDTEVILRAYERWGRECVNHLRGMFAFAIWDEQKQELFLARDPFGIKPLYYYQTDGLFVFASEVRALLASGLVPRKLSLDGLASYLQFGSVQDPLTIIDGVQSLLPGHSLVVKRQNNRIEVNQLFVFSTFSRPHPSRLTPHGSTRAEAVIQLRQILEDSVRQHLVSDVPVGAFLSGGIDSSAIVALMSRVADQKPKTFSVVFKESEFSEAGPRATCRENVWYRTPGNHAFRRSPSGHASRRAGGDGSTHDGWHQHLRGLQSRQRVRRNRCALRPGWR